MGGEKSVAIIGPSPEALRFFGGIWISGPSSLLTLTWDSTWVSALTPLRPKHGAAIVVWQHIWCCPNKRCGFKFNYESRSACYRCGTLKGGHASSTAPPPRGNWANGVPPEVRQPKPKAPPQLTDQQVQAYASMGAEAYEAIESTLGQSARDRVRRARSLQSGDPTLVSKASAKEHEQLTDKAGRQQTKYDKALANLQKAAQWAAQCGLELDELKAKQKEVAARGAAALAKLGHAGDDADPCAALLQQAQQQGSVELVDKLRAMQAEMA